MGFYILPRADGKEGSKIEEKGKNKWESNYQEAQHTSSLTRGLTS
jgi:hypothetical protein